MPAKDIYHATVKAALIKDGWTITDDPLNLKIGTRNTAIDLGAEKIIAAERGKEKIASKLKALSAISKKLGDSFFYMLEHYESEIPRVVCTWLFAKTFLRLFSKKRPENYY